MLVSALPPALQSWGWLREAAALATVLGLVVLAGAAARRSGTAAALAPGSGALRLRARLALDARRRLHLVDTPAGAVLVLTGGSQDRIMALPAEPNRPGPP
jgi:flagellar biogenesis protein FliO